MSLKEALIFLKESYFTVLNDITYSITMFLFLVLGILYPKFAEYSSLVPPFLIYVYGGTGTRKTTTVMSMLNPFEFRTASFEDTLASVVEQFRNMELGCFIIDDMKIVDKNALVIVNKIIRMVGDSTTQGLKMRGNNVITQTVRSACVMTGEHELHLQESSMARILCLPYNSGTVNLTKLSELSAMRSELCTAILKVIQRTMQNYDFMEKLCEDVLKKRSELNMKFLDKKLHGRYIDMMAWLIAMYNVLESYFKEECVDFAFDYVSNIEKLIETQHLKYRVDPTSIFAEMLFGMAEENFLDICNENEFSAGKTTDIIDYQEEWFIITRKVFSKMLRYAQEKDVVISFSEKTLRAELLANSILKQYSGKNTRELRKGTGKGSGYYIRKNELKKYRYGGF